MGGGWYFQKIAASREEHLRTSLDELLVFVGLIDTGNLTPKAPHSWRPFASPVRDWRKAVSSLLKSNR